MSSSNTRNLINKLVFVVGVSGVSTLLFSLPALSLWQSQSENFGQINLDTDQPLLGTNGGDRSIDHDNAVPARIDIQDGIQVSGRGGKGGKDDSDRGNNDNDRGDNDNDRGDNDNDRGDNDNDSGDNDNDGGDNDNDRGDNDNDGGDNDNDSGDNDNDRGDNDNDGGDDDNDRGDNDNDGGDDDNDGGDDGNDRGDNDNDRGDDDNDRGDDGNDGGDDGNDRGDNDNDRGDNDNDGGDDGNEGNDSDSGQEGNSDNDDGDSNDRGSDNDDSSSDNDRGDDGSNDTGGIGQSGDAFERLPNRPLENDIDAVEESRENQTNDIEDGTAVDSINTAPDDNLSSPVSGDTSVQSEPENLPEPNVEQPALGATDTPPSSDVRDDTSGADADTEGVRALW